MKLTGAQIVTAVLREQNVNTVFGYPGGNVLKIYDEIYKTDSIRHIITSHEQGAAHAADGYARTSGKVGVVIATSGPGATNLGTGIGRPRSGRCDNGKRVNKRTWKGQFSGS